jgi:hypothetical protein
VATLSIGYFSLNLISQSQSIGLPRESTTLQINHSQTGTSNVLQVHLATSHSLILLNQDKTTTQTKCSSKFIAIQTHPDSNSTSSLYATFLSQETLAIESHK